MLEINEYQVAVVRNFIEGNWCNFLDCCCEHCEKDALSEDGTTLARDIAAALGDDAE